MKTGKVLASTQNKLGAMWFSFRREAAVPRVETPTFTFLKSEPVVYLFKLTMQARC